MGFLKEMSGAQVVLAILGVGFLIAWHELGHYLVARLLGMRVLKYSIGFGPRLVGKSIGGIEYQLAAFPFGGFVQIKGMSPLEPGAVEDERSFIMRPRWARWLVLGAGPGFNYLLAFALFFLYVWAWPSPVSTPAIDISTVMPDRPAAVAGMKDGDIVTHIDGTPLTGMDDFKGRIAAGKPLVMRVLRDDQPLDLTVTPAETDGGFLIGVAPAERAPRNSIGDVVVVAGRACVNESVRTLAAFGALFAGKEGVQVGGPVAIVAEMKDRIARGTRFFVFIMAVLSVNLGLLNLLPVPSLDGVKMLFLMIEGALRRNLNAAFQVYVNAAGLIALLGLMVVLMARDTIRLLG